MKYTLKTLSTGLRVLTVPMPSLDSATVTVWVRVGSRFEDSKVSGISHFLEHMVFKGSAKRPTAAAIGEAIDSIGGEFNAGTSKEYTNFYIRSRTTTLETAFDVLSDMVLRPILAKADIEREKGVIVEEIAMYEDTPMQNIGNIFEQLLYEGNQLGSDIIGTPKSVRSITKKDFEAFRSKHYFAKNMLVTVSGGVTESEVVGLAEKYFGEIQTSKPVPKYAGVVVKQTKPKLLLRTKKSEQAHFILGFRGFPAGHPDRFAEGVLASIMGGGMSSRLFTEIREKRGLAYAVHVDADHYQDTGVFGIYAGVVLTKIDEAIKVTLDQCYKIANEELKITSGELTKAKEYIRGHLALSLENTKAVNYFFGERELMRDKIETPEEIFKAISKVSVQDVVKIAKKLFVKEKLNLAIIGPYKDKKRFENLISE